MMVVDLYLSIVWFITQVSAGVAVVMIGQLVTDGEPERIPTARVVRW